MFPVYLPLLPSPLCIYSLACTLQMGEEGKVPVEWSRVACIYFIKAQLCFRRIHCTLVIIVSLLFHNHFSVVLCAEDTTVWGNEEEHKPKDQEDCKIKSKAPNKKRKRSNMEKSLDVSCERFTQISKEETER